MIVYSGTKETFLQDVEDDVIAERIEQKILEKLGRKTPASEFQSWVNSLEYMYKVLTDREIPSDSGVALEYNLPQTAKRVDFMVSGYDEHHKPGMVIVELKQWSELSVVPDTSSLVSTFVGKGIHRLVHPSYQAWSYAKLLEDYNCSIQDSQVSLSPCAYLHNYIRKDHADPIDDPCYGTYTSQAPAFTRGQNSQLRKFIKSRIRSGDAGDVIRDMDHGKIRPSKSLQDAIASMIRGNREFVMIDEQMVAFETVMNIAKKCLASGKKQTVICQGGPGTGKSVIAVQLLAALTSAGQVVQYVSKNNAPRQVYAAKLKGNVKSSSIDNMFKGSGSFVETPADTFDTLIVDEAHRLNEKSGLYGNLGENQIAEIIRAAKCSVFFIDEHQRVTLKDIGSRDEIRKHAARNGSEVIEFELNSQFRCNGSNGYLSWLDNVLGIKTDKTQNGPVTDYEFAVFDTPDEVLDLVKSRNLAGKFSRLLAGYCWEWPMKGRSDTDSHDIRIGDFSISWNLNSGKAYALDDDSVNQAGCIHTTQGLEFEYVGVIIGDDMRFENGRIVTDAGKRARTDHSVKGIKKLTASDPAKAARLADEIIRNTYRTLMTRGMKGCFVYCTDENLREYLKRMFA